MNAVFTTSSTAFTLDYVYELDDRTLTIWFMKKGSDNRFTGTMSADGNSHEERWHGGGYAVIAARIQ